MRNTHKSPIHSDLRDLLRLNHHHMLYFAAVMDYGGVHAAARHLGVTATTISSQIKALEAIVGQNLFLRRRQRLVPSPFGERIYILVSAWLAAGRRVLASVEQTTESKPEPLHIGIADGVPLLVAARILKKIRSRTGDRQIICRTTRHDALLDELTHHHLDIVLTDRPPAARFGVELSIRWVESSSIAWCASSTPQRPFPDCLHRAAVILPMRGFAMRESIDAWLTQQGLEPLVVAECSESALVKTLGASGMGMFPVPSIVADQVCSQFAVTVVGRQAGETERYMLVTHQSQALAELDAKDSAIR
jgi:LysR family transcriptional activator of nhaA